MSKTEKSQRGVLGQSGQTSATRPHLVASNTLTQELLIQATQKLSLSGGTKDMRFGYQEPIHSGTTAVKNFSCLYKFSCRAVFHGVSWGPSKYC
jgi:hypothetical protein